MEHGRQGRQRASETIRKQKRKELDARRSKCRIRIGSHLEQWCQLKEQLGFSLHSQLAKYLLDRYSSQGCSLKTGQDSSGVTATPLPAEALQNLVVLSHNHSQECGFIPDMKSSLLSQKEASGDMVWECLAGHTFSWSPPSPLPSMPPPRKATSRCRQEKAMSSKPSPPPSPIIRRRRSLRRAAAAHAFSLALASDSPCPVDEAEPPSKEDEASADQGQMTCLSPSSGTGPWEEAALLDSNNTETATPSEEVPSSTEVAVPESTLPLPDRKLESEPNQPEEVEEGEGGEEDLAEEDHLAYADDLRDENYHPSLDRDFRLQRHQNVTKCFKGPVKENQLSSEMFPPSHSPSEEKGGEAGCKKRAQPGDEDVAQIGPKRIRKAAKREILLCDYEGCGKIFSNRQYLNHHKKYQHVHQKTFTCSDPSCGKSFNFKKHLKEHEKLHSDKRDYICEFCARSFRTSSNLIIHRRIHTGEKPLQCEICGFTCRQKASLNWHMKKHDADSFYQFSCDLCGKKFEKKDNVTAHKSKSHPEAATGPPQLVPEPPTLCVPLAMEHLEHLPQSQPINTEKRVEESALTATVVMH
ncbi:zinc finger protein 692 [Eublepharis macularius]|uniref:Zinc finger protein 692 n=1 Tax=Eublepharis macularius TaxID=481883 RepID=A0AA97J6A1_EUBMA|nr:zinc finger protein 692 [Eublepharis macularius]